jgi:hypothetical protein
VSRGLDRDRVVDETGNQTVVFGRRGSRPFNLEEMHKFYWRSNTVYTVEDVALHDGKLQAKSGAELKPDAPFKPVVEEVTVRPPNNERLIRRGK